MHTTRIQLNVMEDTYSPPPPHTEPQLCPGPDCGIMHVSVDGHTSTHDTYAPTVTWETVLTLGESVKQGSNVTISVSGDKNPKSTNSYVQIVSVNLFS